MPIPLKGDRGAFDVANYATRHASDLEAAAPTVHNPTPGAAGTVPISDGSKWVASTPDSGQLNYTPAVLTDWDGDTDPGNVDDALDQLAGRVDDLEGGAGHDPVTLDVNAGTLLSLSTQEVGLNTQTANYVFAGPESGADAAPTFRALTLDDLPEGIGGGSLTVVTIDDTDSPYSVQVGDYTVRCDCMSGPVEVLLPAATGSGRVLNVKKIDVSVNPVLITGDGFDLIDSVSPQDFNVQYDNVQLQDAASGAWDVL
jgi:hypothetical protein